MISLLKLIADESLVTTPVSNNFIENYMPLSNPIYSLIYIYLFKKYANHEEVSKEDLAKKFNILETDVNNALQYWKDNKLINLTDTTIEFLLPAKVVLESATQPSATQPSATRPSAKPPMTVEQCPNYSTDELKAYGKQSEIKDLYSYAEKKFGRMLRKTDLNLIFALYDWLRMSPELIKKLLDHCTENGHSNLNYIEAVALDWRERNINTPAEAEEYIFTFTKTYREILKAFGQGNRSPVPREVEYMEKWLNEFKMPLEIILEACDRTIMATGKPSFKYADSIILNWHNENIKTIDEIIALEKDFAKTKSEEKKKPRQKKNKFSNFEGREIDYSEIEKLEQQLLDNVVSGSKTSK